MWILCGYLILHKFYIIISYNVFNSKYNPILHKKGGNEMIQTIKISLNNNIDFLRHELEYLVNKNDGKITEEVVKLSEKLDKLLVLYYLQG